MEFEFEEGVKLVADRVPGTRNDECKVYATSSTALVKGLCWLMNESAKHLGMTIQELLCRVAVVLLDGGRNGDGHE